MVTKKACRRFRGWPFSCAVALLVMTASSCSRPAPKAGVRIVPANQESAGFLSNYANLKPNPNFENTRSWVSGDDAKNIHRYVAVIIDPPVVYVSTDTAEKDIPDRGAAALREYFQD